MTITIDLDTASEIYGRIQAGTATAADLATIAAGRSAIQTDETLGAILGTVAAAAASNLTSKRMVESTDINEAQTALNNIKTAVDAVATETRPDRYAVPMIGGGYNGPFESLDAVGLATQSNCRLRLNFHMDFIDQIDGYEYKVQCWTNSFNTTSVSPYSKIRWIRRALTANLTDPWEELLDEGLRWDQASSYHPYMSFMVLPLKKKDTSDVVPCLIGYQKVDNTVCRITRWESSTATSYDSPNLNNPHQKFVYDTQTKVILCENQTGSTEVILYADQADITVADATIHKAFGTTYALAFGDNQTQINRYINFGYAYTTLGSDSQEAWVRRIEKLSEMMVYKSTNRTYDDAYEFASFGGSINGASGADFNFYRISAGHFNASGANTEGNAYPGRPQINRHSFFVRTGVNTFEYHRFLYFHKIKRTPYGDINTVPDQWTCWPESIYVRCENAETGELIFDTEVWIDFRPTANSNYNTGQYMHAAVPVHYDATKRLLTMRYHVSRWQIDAANDYERLYEQTYHV